MFLRKYFLFIGALAGKKARCNAGKKVLGKKTDRLEQAYSQSSTGPMERLFYSHGEKLLRRKVREICLSAMPINECSY